MRPPKDVTQLLRDLIAIPSVNPDGDPGTDQTGEKACAEYVAEFLKLCGAKVTLEEVRPQRPNVIGRFPCSNPQAPRVLFGPHLDTVGVTGMTIDPFGAEVRDGRIWGRGASDTKGSVASMLWAIYETRDLIPELDLEVSFAGFMSEESEQYGSQHYAKHHADKTDFAIVGEPTDMDAVVAHKACWWFDITTTGLAAHSSKPQLGENSISKMVRLIAAMESELPVQLAAFENEMLGLPTSSFNMIQGGSRPNIVPDECTVTLDIRATPELFAQGVDTFIQGILDETGFVDAGLHIRTKSPTLDTDPQNPIVQRFVEQGSKLVGAPWFCDAGWLAVGGIPGIAIGPGSIAQAHTEDEWIKIEDLESGAWRFAEFLRSYGK